MKENFQITDKETGKTYWISRAMAVAGVIMYRFMGQWHFLLETRGPGCPDNIGKLCGVCGYLNWGETRKDAIARECYEETGYKPDPKNVIELETIDDPTRDARENIVTRYAIIADYNDIFEKIKNGTINSDTASRGGEADEVSNLGVFTLEEIEKIPFNDFAFGHKEMIKEIVEKLRRL